MKFNWGWGIVLSIAGFMAFIIYLIGGTLNENVDLVAPDYYNQEVHYQEKIDATNLANKIGKLSIVKDDQSVTVILPEALSTEEIKMAKVDFYRADNQAYDRAMEGVQREFSIASSELIAGKYSVRVLVELNNGASAYWEETIWK